MQSSYLASFGRRRGRRLRRGKQRLMDETLPRVQLPDAMLEQSITLNDLQCLFPNPQNTKPFFVEIGFGTGVHLAEQARQHPEAGLIGCEPYIHGVGDLLRSIEEEGLNNIRILANDARLFLDKLPDHCLDKVFILYPDPWPKARHHKRRLISKEFLALLARVMKPGGELRLATDDENYLNWILEHILSCEHFAWQAKECGDWKNPPPGWVCTRYEEKALKAGRQPSYLNFKRI